MAPGLIPLPSENAEYYRLARFSSRGAQGGWRRTILTMLGGGFLMALAQVEGLLEHLMNQ